MVTMRWFSRSGCLNNARIGLKHRIFFTPSVGTTKIGQFEIDEIPNFRVSIPV
jgi:hypothetical protein